MKVYFHQEKIKTIHLVNTRVIDSDGQMSFYGVFIFSVFSMPFKVITPKPNKSARARRASALCGL